MFKKRQKIAIFGIRDSMAGQLIEYMKVSHYYDISYFISIDEIPDLNIPNEHSKRPNDKTEFVVNQKFFGKPVFIGPNYIQKLKNDGIDKVAVFEDDKDTRSFIYSSLTKSGIQILSFIHSSVFLGGKNDFGTGVIIFPQCYIGYKSDVGDGTVIQSKSVIEHHNVVGKFTHINPGLTTGGFTKIGDFVEIKMQVDIVNRIKIENRAVIGAGSLILNNCNSNTLYYGRPAKAIRNIYS